MKALFAICCLAALGAVGCVSLTDPKVKELDARVVVKTSFPVSADQVNAQNAYEATQHLWDELDHEEMTKTPPSKTRK